jgi:hypothetical protein
MEKVEHLLISYIYISKKKEIGNVGPFQVKVEGRIWFEKKD